MKKIFSISLIFPIILLFLTSVANGATKTASVTGNWNNMATWGGGVPADGDVVIINSGVTVTLDGNTANVASIAINAMFVGGTNGIAVGGFTLNTGSITIAGSGTAGRYSTLSVTTGIINCSGSISFSGTAAQARLSFLGAGTLNIGGNLGAGGTFAALTGTVNCNGSNAQTIAGYTYYIFKSNNAAGASLLAASTMTTLTIGDNTSNSIFSDGGYQITNTGTLNLLSGTFKLGGATATTLPAFTTRNISVGTTVEYASTASQSVSSAPSYANIVFSGASTKTVAANLTIGGDLTISGGTLNLVTYIANRTTEGGTLTVAGTLNIAGTSGGPTGSNFPNNFSTLLLTGGTVNYNKTSGGQTIYSIPHYNNLTLGNTSGTQLAGGNLEVDGIITTTAGGTLDMVTYSLSATAVPANLGIIKTQNTSASPIPTGKTWAGTLNYNALTGGQTIMMGNYGALTLGNTSGTQTAEGNLNISGILTTTAGGTLNMGANTLSATGAPSNLGTITTQNTSANAIPTGKTWGGTVVYNALATQTISTGAYTNLTISGSDKKTLAGNSSVSAVLTLSNATTLDLSNFTLSSASSIVMECGAISGSSIIGTGTLTPVAININNIATGTSPATISCPINLTGTRTFTVANDGTAATDLIVSGVISGSFGITKAGQGTMVLSGANTYTGVTTISNGTMKLGAAGNGTNSPLGTIAGNTVVANLAVLDLNGITLSTTEGLTINGTGLSGSPAGALTNTGSNASYSGTITLGTASTITATTSGTLTASAIAITTLALTLDGDGNGIVSGVISGTTATLIKAGTGSWLLSNANTYAGLTTVNAGVLRAGIINALFTGPLTVNDRGTYDLNGYSDAIGALIVNSGTTGGRVTTGSGTLTLGSNVTSSGGALNALISGNLNLGGGTRTFTLTNAADGLTVSAIISTTGTFGITKAGNGVLTLSGLNTFTGITTINAGVLSVATIGNGGVAGNMGQATNAAANIVMGGGTLQYTGISASTDRSFTLTAGTTSKIDISANDLTISGASTNTTGALTKLGAGTLVLSGTNLYTGTTTINVGTLQYGITNALLNGAVTVNGGTYNIASYSDAVGTVTLTNGVISGTTGVLTGASYAVQNGSISAILAGAVALTKTNAGTVTMTGLNTYTGITTISAGVLSVATIGNGGVAGNLGQASNVATNLVLGGGTLQYTGSDASTNRAFTLIAGTTSTIDVSANTLTISGAGASTTGALTKAGAGTLVLTGANLFTGATTIAAGNLIYGANNAMSSGAITINGGILNIGIYNNLAGAVTLIDGAIVGSTGVLTGTSYAVQNGTISAILAGAVALTKTTAGTVVLSGANTYTGITTINDGVLSVATIGNGGVAGNMGQASNAAANLVLGGGTLRYTGGSASTNRSFTITAGTTSALDVPSNILTISGAAVNTSGALTKMGLGTLVLSGANLYTGLTLVNAGMLEYGISNALSSGPVTVNGGTLNILNYTDAVGAITLVNGTISGTTGVLTGTSYTVQNGSVSAILAGTGPLTKNTVGTVTMSGTNTYTGITTISEGVLGVATIGNGGVAGNLGQASKNADNLVLAGGTLQYTGVDATTDRAFTLTSATTSTIDITTNNLSISGDGAASSGALIKIGNGTLTLSGANYYSGGTTLRAGILTINNAAALGTVAGTFTIEGGDIDNTSGGDIITLNYPLVLNSDFSYRGTLAKNLNLGTGNVSFSANREITVGGAMLTIGGIINEPMKDLTKEGGGVLSFDRSSVALNNIIINDGTLIGTSDILSVAGNWSNYSAFTHNNGRVAMVGTTAQTIGGIVPTTFYILTAANTGSNDGASNIITLDQATIVNFALNLNGGIMKTSASAMLELLLNTTSNTGAENSFVWGPMKKTGNEAFTFGTGTVDGSKAIWAPVGIGVSASATDSYTAQYYFEGPGNNWQANQMCNLNAMDHVSGLEYWDLHRVAGTAVNYPDVTLYWKNGAQSQILNYQELMVAHREDDCWQGMNGTPLGNNATGYVTGTGFTSYSPVTLGTKQNNNPLPIQLLSFDAECNNNSMAISWTTATETNNDYFTVERSTDATNWKFVCNVNGAGNSNSVITYRTVDISPMDGPVVLSLETNRF
ncbi:MAG: autotransporter-associated beta strand repeat-containing protein [Bacteroidota bacterium]